MATKEQVKSIIKMMHQHGRVEAEHQMNRMNMGIFAVLVYLSENNNQAKSKNISEALGVSTARMAKIVSKIESKGLVERKEDEADARITIVKLTDKGVMMTNKVKEHHAKIIGITIDEFGYDGLLDFLDKLKRLQAIMISNQFEVLE